MRAEVIDRVVDPILILKDYLKEYLLHKELFGDVAQAAIFVLGNADDKVVSTGGAGDRFEFVHKIITALTDCYG